jgi:hypothetical protein
MYLVLFLFLFFVSLGFTSIDHSNLRVAVFVRINFKMPLLITLIQKYQIDETRVRRESFFFLACLPILSPFFIIFIFEFISDLKVPFIFY